ncbi:hydroxymethylbilane synthase [Candidatus Marinamargulisbacteria bacterium SCGC AG-439-L15]|nr:hydroxymethylbilane synthase [Candidatus Marinamargulisbacteria bacterium SCGC AG-439-L15]
MNTHIKIGTRRSDLAMMQAQMLKQILQKEAPNTVFELVPMSTTGDDRSDLSLSTIGGKGLFIKEIEHALLEGKVDIAVHSFKDVTSVLAEGTQLTGFLTPESQADCLVLKGVDRLEQLPKGASIATGSLRRKALIKRVREDIELVDIRGNVPTRLSILKENEALSGVMLSEAGFIRLGISDQISERLDPDFWCPAPGQGVIAMQTRNTDTTLSQLMQSITSADQRIRSSADWLFLTRLGFDCTVPLGFFSRLKGDQLYVKGFIAASSLDQYFEDEAVLSVSSLSDEIAMFADRFQEWRGKVQ